MKLSRVEKAAELESLSSIVAVVHTTMLDETLDMKSIAPALLLVEQHLKALSDLVAEADELVE